MNADPIIRLFLSGDEVTEVTEYSRKAEQRKQLDHMGIPYEITRSGRPLVLREVINQRFGLVASRSQSKASIDVNALRGELNGP